MFIAVLRMNPSRALEWLLESCVGEESEDAVDLKQEAEQTVASGKMR
jgi:hypothetical protein